MIDVEIETGEVARALRRYAHETGDDFGKTVRRHGRLLAVDLARRSQPFGDGDGARKSGEKAVAKDIRKVFRVPSSVFKDLAAIDPGLADAFWYFLKIGRLGTARKLLAASHSRWADVPMGALNKSLHQTRRNSAGRVRSKVAAQIVTNTRSLNAYIAKKKRLVGYGKAGWAACARQLGGTRGIPQWITRHRGAPAFVQDETRRERNPELRFGNNVDYASRILSRSDEAAATGKVTRGIMKEMEHRLDARARRRGLAA